LLKVWGITSMAAGGALFLACLLILIPGYFWARRHDAALARHLRLGFWGGLLGTLGYDIVRVPFHLAGFRVFAPIQAYGVWLAEAQRSSGFTEALGWLYHFSNGITFGIMYALVMGGSRGGNPPENLALGRHWGWGVLWGLCLESIVLSTPFARIFHLQGNVKAIAIAYGAHVFYGLPLGWVVARGSGADRRLSDWSGKLGALVVLTLLILSPIPMERERDSRAVPGTLKVEGYRLNPTWLRLSAPGRFKVSNPNAQASREVTIVQPSTHQELHLKPGEQSEWGFDSPGIYQVYVKAPGRSISSFVIVEPVEQPQSAEKSSSQTKASSS